MLKKAGKLLNVPSLILPQADSIVEGKHAVRALLFQAEGLFTCIA